MTIENTNFYVTTYMINSTPVVINNSPRGSNMLTKAIRNRRSISHIETTMVWFTLDSSIHLKHVWRNEHDLVLSMFKSADSQNMIVLNKFMPWVLHQGEKERNYCVRYQQPEEEPTWKSNAMQPNNGHCQTQLITTPMLLFSPTEAVLKGSYTYGDISLFGFADYIISVSNRRTN